jgi:tellurite resistance protein TerB
MLGFGKKIGSILRGAKKIENRDLMEAIVGGCLLVAAADGEIEKSESQKIEQLIRSNENLGHFGNEITKVVTRFTGLLEADFGVGRLKILREIRDVSNNADDSEEVVINMIAVAKADGEIEPEELKVLEEVARELGVRLDPELLKVKA